MSIERGHDPRAFTLVAGGGAGALHATNVARALGCGRVYVPRHAGVFCAFGMCSTDVRQDFRLTWLRLLDDDGMAELEQGFAELTARATSRLAESGFSLAETAFERSLELRYQGQQWPLQVPVQSLDPSRIRGDFEARHARQYGHYQPGGDIEIVHLGLAGIGRLKGAEPLLHELTRAQARAARGARDLPGRGDGLSGRTDLRRARAAARPGRRGAGTGGRAEYDGPARPGRPPRGRPEQQLLDPRCTEGAGVVSDDPIALALLQKQLDHIARQMGWVMTRTARSPIFSQSHDFSCFIGDARGNVVSQADGLPIHTGGGRFAIQAVLKAFDGEIADGDVYILSDPYEAGGNHLPDWTIIRPVFVGGRLTAFCCNRAHQSDIGGGAAGTYNAAATEIFHEGIRLPVLRLIEGGKLRRDLWHLLLLNSRCPDLLDGDLRAMVGSTEIGAKRTGEVLANCIGRRLVEARRHSRSRRAADAQRADATQAGKLSKARTRATTTASGRPISACASA